MVESLLAMKSKLDEIVSQAFKDDESFIKALKDSFEFFINRRSNKPAELVAKFVDAELKAGSKKKSEEELEATLEKALMLFRYISVSSTLSTNWFNRLIMSILIDKIFVFSSCCKKKANPLHRASKQTSCLSAMKWYSKSSHVSCYNAG